MARQPRPHRVKGTRWTFHGRRVPSHTPGATAQPFTSETFYAKVGGKRVSLGTSDPLEAAARLRDLLREGPDPAAAHRKRPLEEHLTAFLAHLDARGTSAKRRDQVLHDVRWLARTAGWDKLPSLTAEGLENALARLRGEGRAGHTRRAYRQHAQQFASWCVRTGRMQANPFLQVPGVNVDLDRKFTHRCPTPQELGQLFAYLDSPTCPVRCSTRGTRNGLTGPERAMGYKVCLGTGFRANELRALRRASFMLDDSTVTLPTRRAKNRKPTVQPLPAWLVEQLRSYFAAGGPTWERLPAKDQGRLVLDGDLNGAGIALSLEGADCPQRFTFHSFRVSFIDSLCQDPANSLKTIMDLARHSDARLTLSTYAKYHRESAAGALDRLPPPGTAR